MTYSVTDSPAKHHGSSSLLQEDNHLKVEVFFYKTAVLIVITIYLTRQTVRFNHDLNNYTSFAHALLFVIKYIIPRVNVVWQTDHHDRHPHNYKLCTKYFSNIKFSRLNN